MSEPGDRNRRAHDLIDIQIILSNAEIDLHRLNLICGELFRFRKRHHWPTPIVKRPDWDSIYLAQKRNIDVLPTCDEAICFVNKLIEKISNA